MKTSLRHPARPPVGPHPNPAGAVLKPGIGRVAGQAFGLSIDHEDIVAPPAETAVGPNPKVAFAILEDAAHAVAVLGILLGRGDEAVALEPRHAIVRARPEIAVAVRPQGANRRVRQPLAQAVLLDGAAGGAADNSPVAGDPDIAVAIGHHGEHHHAVECSGLHHGDEFPTRPAHHAAEAGHPKIFLLLHGCRTDAVTLLIKATHHFQFQRLLLAFKCFALFANFEFHAP